MALLKSKLLDKKVMESAKETLKKVQECIYCKKTKCCSSRSKNMLHFENNIDYMDKAPKTWKRRKVVYSPINA
ncbi:hypothetical protein GO684_04470 [Wolbachia endosymbiont of Litomosoides brasiliensis]|uniref:hypothetical protein n=1 Tax=Wolbachia endosymbiont of Litomosoides brasiliensis TaxID=1812117 RepID=UPI00158B4363|nr:hypothetical protein [Wolbachia endosymbiont of Litomosoides brasiliensis]NUY39858.1 hypothetical protein [Wolbachia endosymbiont of Litomosoides brasiliensis]